MNGEKDKLIRDFMNAFEKKDVKVLGVVSRNPRNFWSLGLTTPDCANSYVEAVLGLGFIVNSVFSHRCCRSPLICS